VRQLAIKGRRLLAGRLARTIEANGWSPEEASAEYELPVVAVLEAQRYAAENAELVDAEETEERLAAGGEVTMDPPEPSRRRREPRAAVR